MKLLIWLFVILSIAVGISLVAGSSDGYVLLVQPPYRIELSVNVLILLMLLAFFSFHGILRLTHYTLQLPARVKAYKQQQRQKEAHAALIEGLHALVEGRYSKAEKTAAHALELQEDAGLSALIAARAAHKQKRYAKRDFYLAEAERVAPEAATARLLSQAEMLLDEGQNQQALYTLQQLEKIEPRYLPALKLEQKLHTRLGNVDQLLSVLQQLEKRGGVELVVLTQLRRHATQQLLSRYSHDRDLLLTHWKKIPENTRLESGLSQFAAKQFIAAGDTVTAAQIVEMSLTQAWDTHLVKIYGECAHKEVVKQLQQAEAWLLKHPQDANLLLSLGQLCLYQRLWGKAQSYLEASLSIAPSQTVHIALAELFEQTNKPEEANAHYRLGLLVATR